MGGTASGSEPRTAPSGDVISARPGFLADYSFVRDRSGGMYWADRGQRTVVKKRLPDGTIVIHSTGPFRDVRWMTVAPDGVVYLVDSGRLLRIATDGTVSTIVAALSEKRPRPAKVADRHYQRGSGATPGVASMSPSPRRGSPSK